MKSFYDEAYLRGGKKKRIEMMKSDFKKMLWLKRGEGLRPG